MQENSDQAGGLVYNVYDGTDEFMPPAAPLIIMHGLMDCKENWKNIAETIANKTTRKVYVLDLPHHGDSQWNSEFLFENVEKAMEDFALKINEPVIILGHSVGGSIAISLTLKKPEIVERLILIDISPLDYPHDAEDHILLIVQKLKNSVKYIPETCSLKDAKEHVKEYFHSKNVLPAIQKMVLPNLMKTENGFKWKCNLKQIEECICLKKTVRSKYPFIGVYDKPVISIHGQSSDYVNKANYQDIKKKVFPNIKFVCVNNCNHWVHIEKKDDLLEAILDFLLRK